MLLAAFRQQRVDGCQRALRASPPARGPAVGAKHQVATLTTRIAGPLGVAVGGELFEVAPFCARSPSPPPTPGRRLRQVLVTADKSTRQRHALKGRLPTTHGQGAQRMLPTVSTTRSTVTAKAGRPTGVGGG